MGKDRRIVLYDTLLKQMDNDEEVLAVLAHELGHWYLSHTVKSFVISLTMMFLQLFLFSFFINDPRLPNAFGFSKSFPLDQDQEVESRATFIALTLFLQFALAPLDEIVHFFLNLLTRKHEYEADAFAT